MARTCANCGKTVASGSNVSHSQRHTKRTFKPNLQVVKNFNGLKGSLKICSRCIKASTKVN